MNAIGQGITTVLAARDIRGDIIASGGRIQFVDAASIIGNPRPQIRAKWGIQQILSAGTINADIDASTNAGTGRIGRVQACQGGFAGSLISAGITANQSNAGIFLQGVLDANIIFSAPIDKPISASGFSAGRTITVAGCIDPNCTMTFGNGSGPFAGTINVNFLSTTFPGFFEGDIVCGAFSGVLTTAEDARASASITASSVSSTGRVAIAGFWNMSMNVAGEMNGELSAGESLFSTLQVGSVGSTGTMTFAGMLNTNNAQPKIICGGGMAGAITVNGAFAPNSRIYIGDSLASTGTVTVGTSAAAGLAGQMVINRNADAGVWDGTVRYRGETGPVLAPGSPIGNYSSSAADIGGGAVGVVPYRIHLADCVPASGNYFTRAQFEPTPVLIRYYGRIEAGSADQKIMVERQIRDITGQNVWMDCTAMFTPTIRPAGVDYSDRTLRVTYTGTSGDLATGRYRISAAPGGILGDHVDVPGEVDVSTNDYYYFNIGLDCSNQNCIGSIGGEDFIDPDSTWNQLVDCNGNNISDVCELRCDGAHVDHNADGCIDTCDELMGPCPCNVNCDQFLNSQDFFDFISCFFGGACPPGMSSGDYNGDGSTNSQISSTS